MPPNDRKSNNENAVLTSAELENILQVNKKSIELHIEISEQFDEIIKYLDDNELANNKINDKLIDIDKMLFKLIVVLSVIMGSISIGIVVAVARALLKI